MIVSRVPFPLLDHCLLPSLSGMATYHEHEHYYCLVEIAPAATTTLWNVHRGPAAASASAVQIPLLEESLEQTPRAEPAESFEHIEHPNHDRLAVRQVTSKHLAQEGNGACATVVWVQ